MVATREIKKMELTGVEGRMAEMLDRHNDPEDPFDVTERHYGSLAHQADVYEVLEKIQSGAIRAAVHEDGVTYTNAAVMAAINLLFPMSDMKVIELGPFMFIDKIPTRTDYQDVGVRVVPMAVARIYSHLAPGVVLMPSYVNIGASVGSGSMLDTWTTAGTCAQVGERTHVSGGVGLGGVLEPPGAVPVVIGNDCMIGSRSQVVEGALVEDGAVLAMNTSFSSTTRVVDINGTELTPGVVPAWSTVVPNWYVALDVDDAGRPRWDRMRGPAGEVELSARYRVRVIERREPGERPDKAKINTILRDHGAEL